MQEESHNTFPDLRGLIVDHDRYVIGAFDIRALRMVYGPIQLKARIDNSI